MTTESASTGSTPSRWTRMVERLELPTGGGAFGPFEAGLLVVVAVGLTVMQFGGAEVVFLSWFGPTIAADVPELFAGYGADPRAHRWDDLMALGWWVGACVVGYLLLPLLYLRLTGRRARDYYLSPAGFLRHLRPYLLLVSPVLGLVVVVSFWPDFQAIYPFYRHASRSWADLIAWEVLYGIQFFALEFFFRGFMLEGLRRWIGWGAVFVMVVPYCMLHFQKTGSESLGSIVAGVVLGVLALRYRSIWGGVMVHWLVAIAMDVASLVQQGRLPRAFFE